MKIKKKKKMKKRPRDTIILHKCTKNCDHRLYCSWDMAQMDKIVIFHFELYFSLLHLMPPNSPKNENFKKMKKKSWWYHHFTKLYQKSWSYAILPLRYGMWRMQLFLFILGYFLPFYPHNSPKNETFKKNEKKAWRYHHFTQVYQKSWSYGILFLRYDM